LEQSKWCADWTTRCIVRRSLGCQQTLNKVRHRYCWLQERGDIERCSSCVTFAQQVAAPRLGIGAQFTSTMLGCCSRV
jgi:hypothetical protein